MTRNLSTRLNFEYITRWSGWPIKSRRHTDMRRWLLASSLVAIEQALMKFPYKYDLPEYHAKACAAPASTALHIPHQMGKCLKKVIYKKSESRLINDRRWLVMTMRSSSRHYKSIFLCLFTLTQWHLNSSSDVMCMVWGETVKLCPDCHAKNAWFCSLRSALMNRVRNQDSTLALHWPSHPGKPWSK